MFIIVFGGILLSVIVIGIVVMGTLSNSNNRLLQRANAIGVRGSMAGTDVASGGILRDEASRFPALEKFILKAMPQPDKLKLRLAATGRNYSIGGYALVSVMVAVGVAIALNLLGFVPLVASILGGLALGVGVPHFVIGTMVDRRLAAFNEKFPDAIDLMVRGLRSGLPVSETIAAVGQEMPAPIGTEFNKIAQAVKLGSTLDESLWETTKRLDTPEFKFFVISLSVQKETGGNLGETLANLSDILRQRRQMRLKIRAMSSEARASAMILGSLPFIMLAMIYFINTEYASLLFTDPRGQIMLSVAGVIMTVGILVMRKMVRFEI